MNFDDNLSNPFFDDENGSDLIPPEGGGTSDGDFNPYLD
jgi:hypothetical protein